MCDFIAMSELKIGHMCDFIDVTIKNRTHV